MDILYRNQPPAYRGCKAPPESAHRGFLAGLWCYLFGSGSAPAYRTKNGQHGSAVKAPDRCWWQAFPSTPAYKPAPDATSPDDASTGDGGGSACECAPEGEPVEAEEVPTVYIVTG